MEQDCCRELDRFEFPVFASARGGGNASTTSLKGLAKEAKSDEEGSDDEDEKSEADEEDDDDEEEDSNEEEGETARKTEKSQLGKGEARKTLADLAATKGDHSRTASRYPCLFCNIMYFSQTGVSRQASSAEPIDYMPTSDTPAGRLPLFPSWSLLHLGSSFLYSHSSGVSQVS